MVTQKIKEGSVEIDKEESNKGISSRNLMYVVLLVSLIGLGVSLYSISDINNIKNTLNPLTIEIDEFMTKITGHAELSDLNDVPPTNIIQVNTNNLANLQGQIQGLNVNHLGKFLVQYQDMVVLYDYENDIIEGQIPLQQQSQLSDDFMDKFYAHEEVAGLAGDQPVGGMLDTESLDTLQEQFPEVYKDAKEGDFLLRFPTALVIYDYGNDQLVNAVPLEVE